MRRRKEGIVWNASQPLKFYVLEQQQHQLYVMGDLRFVAGWQERHLFTPQNRFLCNLSGSPTERMTDRKRQISTDLSASFGTPESTLIRDVERALLSSFFLSTHHCLFSLAPLTSRQPQSLALPPAAPVPTSSSPSSLPSHATILYIYLLLFAGTKHVTPPGFSNPSWWLSREYRGKNLSSQ